MIHSDITPATSANVADCAVVIPTYNERDNIGALIECILPLPRFLILLA
jgi:hypothetical protein